MVNFLFTLFRMEQNRNKTGDSHLLGVAIVPMKVTMGMEKVKRFETQFQHSLNRSGFINSSQSLTCKISKLSATPLLFSHEL